MHLLSLDRLNYFYCDFFLTIGNPELHRPSCLLFSIMKNHCYTKLFLFTEYLKNKQRESPNDKIIITIQLLPSVYSCNPSLLQSSTNPLITASNSLNILAPYLLLFSPMPLLSNYGQFQYPCI